MSMNGSCYMVNRFGETKKSTNKLMWLEDGKLIFYAQEDKPYITSSVIKDFSHYECSLEECIAQTIAVLNECASQRVRIEARAKDWKNAIGVEFFPRLNGGREVEEDDFICLRNCGQYEQWGFFLVSELGLERNYHEGEKLYPRTNILDFLVEFVGPREQTLEEEEKWDC